MAKRKQTEAKLINRTTITVRFSEVDSMRIVWHGEYVRYFEDGREAFGREFQGIGYADIYSSGYGAPMVEMMLQYKKPLTLNDIITIETRYIDTEAATICFEYIIRRQSDNEIVATGTSKQVFIGPEGDLQLVSPEFFNQWKKRWSVR